MSSQSHFNLISISSIDACVVVLFHSPHPTHRIYIGCIAFENNVLAVGQGLCLIVALQSHSLLFYLRSGKGEKLHAWLTLAIYVLRFSH